MTIIILTNKSSPIFNKPKLYEKHKTFESKHKTFLFLAKTQEHEEHSRKTHKSSMNVFIQQNSNFHFLKEG